MPSFISSPSSVPFHSIQTEHFKEIQLELLKRNIIKFDPVQNKFQIHPDIDLATLPRSLDFDDIAIVQKKNKCKSRLDVDVSSEIIKGIKVKYPIIASNMSTVVNESFYEKIHSLGAFAIMHRAEDENVLVNMSESLSKKCEWVAFSIGIGKGDFDFAKRLISAGTNVICIDVAHGYSDTVIELGRMIYRHDPNVKIILGNTTNTDLLCETHDFVSCLKVGLAQGLVCETKDTAGCTEKQFSAVHKFKQFSNLGIPIMSDGGVRKPADFTKAIAAGASSVMCGSIFAACPESAAETVEHEGKRKKLYAGMASRHVQNKWKGGLKQGTCPEGKISYLDIGESVEKLIERYCGALKSGITYAGCRDILELHKNVEFIKIT